MEHFDHDKLDVYHAAIDVVRHVHAPTREASAPRTRDHPGATN